MKSQVLLFFWTHPHLSWQSPIPPPQFYTRHSLQGKGFALGFPGCEKWGNCPAMAAQALSEAPRSDPAGPQGAWTMSLLPSPRGLRSNEHQSIHTHRARLVCPWCANSNTPADTTSRGTLAGGGGGLNTAFCSTTNFISFQVLHIYHKDGDLHNITHYLLVSHFQTAAVFQGCFSSSLAWHTDGARHL